MNIEREIFKKSEIVENKLISYGFKKIDKKYMFSKNILNNSFRVDIQVLDGVISGKVYDLSFNEEYTNYRVDETLGFASKIREEFEGILLDIRDKCTNQSYFVSNQANRIADLIFKKYGDLPEFAWDKFSGYGIFKNSKNDKWYALIMNINKSKISLGNEEIEVINVKLDKDKVKDLQERNGFYKAYHMNKENWITIILDDTLSDEKIMSYVDESHVFTEQVNEWIVPANPKYYDIVNCFNDNDTIFWKQSSNINVGDIVYLYVASPFSCIMYKCEVVEVNIPYEYRDSNLSMSKVMKIKLIKRFDKDKYTFQMLNDFGIKAIRGPRSMPKKLSSLIND